MFIEYFTLRDIKMGGGGFNSLRFGYFSSSSHMLHTAKLLRGTA